MGGAGSGRKPDPVNALMRSINPIVSHGNEVLIMPNNSGDHAKGIRRNTPVNDEDLVNKAYVDTQIAGVSVTLDNVGNPTANKTFTMANKQLKFSYTAPATADGGFEIEAVGGFSGDLVHIHQHTGNPGASDLVHLEAADSDVLGMRITSANRAMNITGSSIINSTGKLEFRDTGLYIYSSVDGQLDIIADTLLQLGAAGDITLGDGTLRVVRPNTDQKISFGTEDYRFNAIYMTDLYISGNVVIDSAGSGLKIGTAASQLIGFFNATPINQPTTADASATFTANSGTAVNDASTFDGYTLKQVVKALRDLGLLA